MTRDQNQGILFVSHDASRTGAPIALLHFLRWYKANGNRPFSVLLPRDGELSSEFANVAETWALDRSRWCPGGTRATAMRLVGLGKSARRAELTELRQFVTRYSPRLVYKNSISSLWASMLPRELPVLTHVHELDFAFNMQERHGLSRLLAETRQFIACSGAAKENLTANWNVPTELIETVHESICVGDVTTERARKEILEELGIPRDGLLVVGCGTADWRKGADVFIQLAQAVCEQRGDTYFAWIGASTDREAGQFERDVRLTGMTEKIRLKRAVPKPADYLAAADVFALTSREDPYPLVCLEAAAVGKPIVCFARAGGIPEFVEGDCGFIVPYLDVAAMAERVVGLLEREECRKKMGETARRKVTQRHDISVAAPRVMEIIERTIARN